MGGVIRFLSCFVGTATVASRRWHGYYRNEGDTTRYTVQVVNQRHHRTIVFCDHGTWLVSLTVSDHVSRLIQCWILHFILALCQVYQVLAAFDYVRLFAAGYGKIGSTILAIQCHGMKSTGSSFQKMSDYVRQSHTL